MKSNYAFVYRMLWKYSKKIVLFGAFEILFSVAVPFIGVLIPSIIIHFVEKSIPMTVLARNLFIVFLLVGVVYGIQAYLKGRNNFQYIQFVYGKSMKDYVQKCFDLDYEVLEREQTRILQQKAQNCLSENFTGLEGFLRHNVALVTSILGLLLYILFISNISLWIILLLLGISFVQKWVYDKAKHFEASQRTEKSKLNVVQEYIRREAYHVGSGKDIRLYRLSDWLNQIFIKKNAEMIGLLKQERAYFYLYDAAGLILQFIRDGVCYGYLLFQLSQGLDASMFVFYLGLVSGYGTWFSQISDSIAQIGRDHLMLNELRTFLEIQNQKIGNRMYSDEDSVEIVFDHVTFCYPQSDKKILDDLSFRIEKGKKYALVGINGAGKTTIVKLLCGFYKPTEGHIYINGIESSELALHEYWNKVAVVFQDAFIHSFSIAENISCVPLCNTDKKRCDWVLEKAGLQKKIERLEKGTETYLNRDIAEDGVQFSGGEVQKLMLARALYKNADFLILDEPTAALDALAEDDIYQRYQRLIEDKTSLFISHRLASTRFCDSIFFLQDGKMIESGTHEELMSKNSAYSKMFYVQSKYYQEGGTE